MARRPLARLVLFGHHPRDAGVPGAGGPDRLGAEDAMVSEREPFDQDQSMAFQVGEERLGACDRTGRDDFRPGRRQRGRVEPGGQVPFHDHRMQIGAGAGKQFPVAPRGQQVGKSHGRLIHLQPQRGGILQGGILQSAIADRQLESGQARPFPSPQKIAIDENPSGELPGQPVFFVAGGMGQDGQARVPTGDPGNQVGLAGSTTARGSYDQDRQRPGGFPPFAPKPVKTREGQPDDCADRFQGLSRGADYAMMDGHGSHR